MVWCAVVPNCTLLTVPDDGSNEVGSSTIHRDDQWSCLASNSCDKHIDPDISGIGMVLAFAISATITFIVVVVGYITRQLGTESFNTIDRGILSLIHGRRRVNGKHESFKDWTELFDKTVLMLSDQQLVTGLAVLIAAIAQGCTINTYHFQICTFLAWVASNTHLLALTSLRPFLRARPSLLRWRLVGMFIMFAMLFSALVLNASMVWPAAYYSRQLYYDSPARCAWNEEDMSKWEASIIFSLVLLCANYITRTLRLFDTSTTFVNKWFREKPGQLAMRLLDQVWQHAEQDGLRRLPWRILYSVLWAIYITVYAAMELYHSYLAEVAWLFATLFWGLCKVFIVRKDSPLSQYENTWTFGQVVALMLLALPIMAAAEFYHDISLKHRTEHHHNHHLPHLPHPHLHHPDTNGITSPTSTGKALYQETHELCRRPTTTTGSNLSDHHSPLSSTTTPTVPPVTPLPPDRTPPHHRPPYHSLFFRLTVLLLALLSLIPFVLFMLLVFQLSNQFSSEALGISVLVWALVVAVGLPAWLVLGCLGSGLFRGKRETWLRKERRRVGEGMRKGSVAMGMGDWIGWRDGELRGVFQGSKDEGEVDTRGGMEESVRKVIDE